MSDTPRSDGIFLALDKAFSDASGYETKIQLREAARIATEDMERELESLRARREEILGECARVCREEYERLLRCADVCHNTRTDSGYKAEMDYRGQAAVVIQLDAKLRALKQPLPEAGGIGYFVASTIADFVS